MWHSVAKGGGGAEILRKYPDGVYGQKIARLHFHPTPIRFRTSPNSIKSKMYDSNENW